VNDLTAPLQALEGFRAISLAPEFSYTERRKNDNLLSLAAHCWLLGAFGELRTVHILSDKIEIVNLFFFPAAQYALPVYALDFVIIGQRPMVGVVDMICLAGADNAQAEIRALMQQAHQKFPLQQADEPPAWYQTCRSADDFFTRPPDVDGMRALQRVHQWLWTQLTQILLSKRVAAAADKTRHANALRFYKDHHRENTSSPLLKTSFGAAWTEQFLCECLFA
jgi:hypothetical protein